MKTLDDIRAKYPHLGVAIYAYTPAEPVTLEVIAADGTRFTFPGATEEAAVSVAFPEDTIAEPAPPAPVPSALPTPSVFD